MFCTNCSKLAILYTNKTCARCQGAVYSNISVICEKCSISSNICAACLKGIITLAQQAKRKGCNCGRK